MIVIPETQSQEKMDMLRLVGADLRPVPAVPYKDPNNYVKLSGRLAEELARTVPNGAIWANQFDNVANRMGHYRTTGPEIWAQTGGKVDAFTCAVGTGGTLAGVGMFLKERKPEVRIVLADPMGAALYNWYTHGELKAEGSSISEGIGQGRITANLEGAPVDDAFQITDAEALPYIFDLVVEEGLVLGSSSAINIAGAVRVARAAGAGPHHRDHPVRLRHPLPEQAVQPRVPAREGPAGPVLAGLSRRLTHASERPMPDALVSTDWLQTHLDAPDVRVVDATWFLPADRAQTPGPNTRPRTSRGPCSSTSTRSASPRACTRTWCRRRPSSARGCASWASATAAGSWSTTTTASSPRPGCGGCSASWAMTTSWCSTAGWPSGGPRAGR